MVRYIMTKTGTRTVIEDKFRRNHDIKKADASQEDRIKGYFSDLPKMLRRRLYKFYQPDFEMFDYDVYALCGDGCLMEGVSSEAASLAGHLKLSNLCWIWTRELCKAVLKDL